MRGRIPAPSYRRLHKEGRSVADPLLVLYCLPDETIKMGVSVSARIGKATVRNRLRRQVKEAFRSLVPSLGYGGQFSFVVRRRALGATYQELHRSMEALLRRMEPRLC